MTHLRETCGISRDRLIPITRGGAGVWYDTPTALELYAMRTPQDVRIENRLQTKLRGQVKQTHVTPWDRAVLADAAQTLGLRHYDVLHPSWMYQLFMPVWEGQRGFGWMQQHWRMKTLAAPPLPEGLVLPEKFVAARWYFRSTWPRTDTTMAFATEVLKLAAAGLPVVLVHSGSHLDDHADFVPRLPNVLNLRDLYPGMTPENNLAVQSAVLGRCEGFVGTYGGLGQLALTMGKSGVMFYDQWGGTSIVHKHLSDTIALHTGRSFNVLRVGDLPLLQSLLPQVLRQDIAA